jgi:hypothetical protein
LGFWWSGHEEGLLVTLIAAALSMAVAMTFGRVGKSRRWFALASGALALAGFGGMALWYFNRDFALTTLGIFAVGFFGMQIAANFVRK